MTKLELMDQLATAIGNIEAAADTFGDLGAFMSGFRDDQEEQFWNAYDTLRFQAGLLTHLIRQIERDV